MTVTNPLVILVRKLGSALRLYRRHGLSFVADMARAQTLAFLSANAILPCGPVKRAALLSRVLNGGALLSAVVIDRRDVASCRRAVLFPYVRGRFFDAAAVAGQSAALTPIEIMILADCWFRLWDFRQLDEHLGAWQRRLAPTKFAHRLGQMARRVDLRLGRLTAAGAGLDGRGGDVAECLLRGDVFDAQGRLDEATSAYEQAARRQGYVRDVRLNYAFHLLKRGRILDGFTNWAIADGVIGEYPLRLHRPQWTGGRLGRQSLMVIFEHGLGDMIQLARFLRPLRRGHPEARILGRVPGPLLGLMARSFPDVVFVSAEVREPDYDYFVPSVQLPVILEAASLEPTSAYLDLGDPVLPAGAPGQTKRVGICWRGQPRQYELTRSIPLAQFARLFTARDIAFVVLLHRLTDEEARLLRGFDNVIVPKVEDFTALGAVVAACDLVISVDTAVAHVAGAGGRPTLLLSRPDSCWRWGSSGLRSPWYSTVEVLRHPGDMDWGAVLDEAAVRIEGLVSTQAFEAAAL